MTRKNYAERYLERIAAENAIKDAIRQPLVAAINTLADEVRSLREENAEARRLLSEAERWAALVRHDFGDLNSITFELGLATEANRLASEISAFLSQQVTV